MAVQQMVVNDNGSKELETKALTIAEHAKVVRITDESSYVAACALLLDNIKPTRVKWKAYWEPLRESAYKSYKGIMDRMNEGEKPLELAENQVKQEIARWTQEQERIRQAEQRKAQEEAERLEREQREAEALQAIDAGMDEDQVDAMLSAPAVAVAPVLAPTYQKAAGVSMRDNWRARVIDLRKLCAAVAKGLVAETYVLPNESALNKRAQAEKFTMNIPGVMAHNEPVVSGRTK